MYSFDGQLAFGEEGEATLDGLFLCKTPCTSVEVHTAFGTWFADTWQQRRFSMRRATPSEQREGIDRFFTDRLAVEYKTDWTAARTHNAFIETVSVDTRHVAGWVHTSKAAVLAYFIPGDDLVYVCTFDSLRRALPQWMKEFPSRAIPNHDYHTHGVLVPLAELERRAAVVISI